MVVNFKYNTFNPFHSEHWKMHLGIFILLMLLSTTVMPIDLRWSESEVIMAFTLPILCVAGCALYLFTHRSGLWHFSVSDCLVTVWMAYYVLRVWVGNEYPCSTHVLKDISLFLLYCILRPIFAFSRIKAISVSIVLFIFGFYETLYGWMQILHGESRHSHYLLTGSFFNPGPYSAYLLVGLIIGILSMREIRCLTYRLPNALRNTLRVYYFIMLSVMSLTLLLTGSRASFMIFGLFCLWHYRAYYWRWRKILWGMCLALVVVLYFAKQGSANGRLLTWFASLQSWSHAPWMGVGVGGFRHACAQGIAELYTSNPTGPLFQFANVSEYAFCDALKILVEQGVVGFALAIFTMVVILRNLYFFSKPLFTATLSLVAFSFSSYPFELFPYRTILVILAVTPPLHLNKYGFSWKQNRLTSSLLGLIFLFLTISYARAILSRLNADNEAKQFMGYGHAAFIPDYYELLDLEYDNPHFLFQFAKVLRTEKRFNDSNAMLAIGTLISSDPMFYLLQGNNYKDMGIPTLAEDAYRKAFCVMPNRLYPLHQLMVLYIDTRQTSKARQMARQIIHLKPKVVSPATKEMKCKAKQIL